MLISHLLDYYYYKEMERMFNPPPSKPAAVTRKLKNSAGYKARKEYWKR